MLNKVITIGNKIEFKRILTPQEEEQGKTSETYVSQVFDFTDSGLIKVAMPMYKGRIVPLAKDEKYNAYFYTQKGLYYSKVLIVDRYKSGNIYTMEIELKTEPQKYQRRQYYRLEKSLPVLYTELEDFDYLNMIERRVIPDSLQDLSNYEKGNTADISGGGLRFVGKKRIETGHKMMVVFDIVTESTGIKFRLPASVIVSFELQNRPGYYEHRVEFENISKNYREILIKYIFEEERKMRARTR